MMTSHLVWETHGPDQQKIESSGIWKDHEEAYVRTSNRGRITVMESRPQSLRQRPRPRDQAFRDQDHPFGDRDLKAWFT